jgi:nucleotide-binding universal stress UspA family protein
MKKYCENRAKQNSRPKMVKLRSSHTARLPLRGLPQKMSIRTVLVALDGSDRSMKLVDRLDDIKLAEGCKLILCHVIPPPDSDPGLSVDRPQQVTDSLQYKQFDRQLHAYREAFNCNCELEIVTGDPATEILRLSRIHQCDLVVLGTRDLTGIDRVVKGSVSHEVAAEAPCAVFIVR